MDRNVVAHPIISNEAVARVFKRLSDRLQGVVTDTSMMTITPEFSAHFLEVFIKKTEGATFTGDRILLLMLSLPLAVLDLIAPEVLYISCIFYDYNTYIPVVTLLYDASLRNS